MVKTCLNTQHHSSINNKTVISMGSVDVYKPECQDADGVALANGSGPLDSPIASWCKRKHSPII